MPAHTPTVAEPAQAHSDQSSAIYGTAVIRRIDVQSNYATRSEVSDTLAAVDARLSTRIQ